MDQSFLENIKQQQADQRESLIQELGIFELRGLGREIGVPSPTTRKRDELVNLILERLSNGLEPPPQKKNRKGRPCKTLNNINQIMTAMTGGDDTLSFTTVTKRIKPYDEVVTFAQETPVFSLVDNPDKGEYEGVLRLFDKIGYFLDIRSRTKVFIPMDLVGRYHLEKGDYVRGVATKMNTSNQYIINYLTRVNFENADKYNPAFNGFNADKRPVISFEQVSYGDHRLYRGRRNIVEYKRNIYEDNRFVNFAGSMIEKGYCVVVLGLNTSFEDSIMLSNIPKIVNLSTNYAENVQQGLDKVVDAISLVQRLGDVGKKVVLFVNDVVEVLNTLDLCFDNNEKIMGHCPEAVVIAQKLISVARAYKDGSEITLVMTYRDYNCNDIFLINEVFKVSNRF